MVWLYEGLFLGVRLYSSNRVILDVGCKAYTY